MSPIVLAPALAMLAAAVPLAGNETAPPAAAAAIMGPALRITDADRSIRFYTEGLGMTLVGRRDMGAVTELIFAFDKAAPRPVILLLLAKTPGPALTHGNGYARTVLIIPDAAAAAARLKAAGYAPSEIHAGAAARVKIFTVSDPDGYSYEMVERAARP